MKTWLRTGLVTLALWGSASSIFAGTLEVSFELDQGRILFGVPGLFVSEAASFTATGRVVLTGVDSSGMLTGPSTSGSLLDLTVEFTSVPTSPGGAMTFRLTQEGGASGSFDGSALALAPMALVVRLANPTGGTALFANALNADLALLALNTPGSAQVSIDVGLLAVSASGAVRLDVQGSEVSRRFSAPEGAALGYLSLGLLALAGQAAWRRRATR